MDLPASSFARRRIAALFGRSTIVSVATFGIDLVLLWLLVQLFGAAYIPAVAIAFLIAISINYLVSRLWIFTDSDRGIATGFVYFLVNAGIGLLTTMAVFVLLVQFGGLFYLVARVIASGVAGILVFALNAIWNFRAV